MTDKNKSPFEGLYAPINDTHKYLARIGFEGKTEPTEECLRKLVTCHLMTVPFENLDIYYGKREPSLETEKMFKKIVIQRRGGYCFELNGLFMKLLENIGFSCFGEVARIVNGHNYPMPFSHRVNFVDIGDDRFFCDVGYGGPGPKEPVKLVYDTEIVTADGKKFCFVKDGNETILMADIGGKMSPVMIFSQKACDLCDFLPPNSFCAHSEYEPFIHKLMLWRLTETGKCTVDGNILRIKENGIVTERILQNGEEIQNALKVWFGIDYDI